MLKTYWPSFCTLDFPISFPFQRLHTSSFFCLQLHHQIFSLSPYHSAFNSNVSIWGLLFQLCYLKAAPPLLSVILTYLVGFWVPEIIFLIHLFMYSLPYLPWLRCKLLTGRNSSLRATMSSHLEGSLVHSRFSRNLSNWITNTTFLAFMVAAFSLLFFLLFYHLLSPETKLYNSGNLRWILISLALLTHLLYSLFLPWSLVCNWLVSQL